VALGGEQDPKMTARLRSSWRRRARSWWREYRWLVVGALGVFALFLGYIGFAKHSAAMGEPRSAIDLFYLTLQLVALESGAVRPPVPWELQVARLLLPAVVAYTAWQALAVILQEQLRRLGLRFLKGHVIVCGLGSKGLLLARRSLRAGDGSSCWNAIGTTRSAARGRRRGRSCSSKTPRRRGRCGRPEYTGPDT
jgi:hypothetical protein